MLINRNITVHGRRTSIRLECEYWDALKTLAATKRQTIHEFVSDIALLKKPGESLTSAVRVQILVAVSGAGRD